MSRVTVNGRTFEVENGSSVSIVNNVVTVNGRRIAEGLTGIVEVRWDGPMGELTCDANVTCENVSGNVSAGGNVIAKGVSGNVNAGGNVSCGAVGSMVNAGGNVSHR